MSANMNIVKYNSHIEFINIQEIRILRLVRLVHFHFNTMSYVLNSTLFICIKCNYSSLSLSIVTDVLFVPLARTKNS